MDRYILLDVVLDLMMCERRDNRFLKLAWLRSLVAISRLEAVSVIDSDVLASVTDQHLSIPFSRLIQPVTHVQVVGLLALIVSITDQDQLAVHFQFSDLRFGKLSFAQLFGDHILFWSVDGR